MSCHVPEAGQADGAPDGRAAHEEHAGYRQFVHGGPLQAAVSHGPRPKEPDHASECMRLHVLTF